MGVDGVRRRIVWLVLIGKLNRFAGAGIVDLDVRTPLPPRVRH